MKLSEIYGKEVVSRDGSRRGWVRGVLEYGGAPRFLQCFDSDEREFDIDFKSIQSVDGRIVFEDGSSDRKKCRNLRLGMPAYDNTGNFLGVLNDVASGKSGIFYIIGKKRYRPEFICVGDAVIVRPPRTLKESVTAENTVILKKGTSLTPEALKRAEEAGEYFQAQMKTI